MQSQGETFALTANVVIGIVSKICLLQHVCVTQQLEVAPSVKNI